ncbi:processed acidic surface protein [Metabacillus herbersteinensis]|uniref:Processed acidic surface protein n=1 Tax=Metabacillus herbersteinensis TaxID=283816 RepID=A0ABV6GF45_9BACI
MKYLLTLLLAVVFSFSVLPVSSFAIESNDPDFDQFLVEIEWDKQDYIDYLESKDWPLDYFESIDELGTPLSEEGVQSVLVKYELTRDELNALLVEYGDIEEGEDVLDGTYLIFNEELDSYVDSYLNDVGYEGTPIDDDNLQTLLDDYGFASVEELEQFLIENEDSLDDYEFIEDLELAVDFYINGDDYLDEIDSLFTELGLTEEELESLFAHLETLDFEDPAFLDKLLELSDRMMAFEEFESAEELSAEQTAELLDIFSEMLHLFQLETKYYLVNDNEKKPVSFQTLMTMDTTEGYDLLMEVYNTQGDFLADILLTADMIGSDLIKETGKDIKQAEEIVTEKTTSKPVKTVKGGKLPDTASDYVANTLVGFVIALAGVVLFRRIKVKGY